MSPAERAKVLLSAPPDSWLALSEDQSCVVAYGATYAEVVAKAEAAGVTDPSVPSVTEHPYIVTDEEILSGKPVN